VLYATWGEPEVLANALDFRETGCRLASEGLISGVSGNLSRRLGSCLLITARGSDLGCLTSSDIVKTGLFTNDALTPRASSELAVHRAIYRVTPACAIVHAHPAHAVALSVTDMASDVAHVPILGNGTEVVPGVFSEEIAAALKNRSLVMVRGHGSFATGETLEAALCLTITFEEVCRVVCRERGACTTRWGRE